MENKANEKEEKFYASPVENLEFSEMELKRMGVAFFEGLDRIEEAALKLGIENFDKSLNPIDYGLVLSNVGPIQNDSWVLYNEENEYSYVLDILEKKNFYSISIETKEGLVEIFNKAHLRDEFLEEDLGYYIGLHLEMNSAPVHTSEYLN